MTPEDPFVPYAGELLVINKCTNSLSQGIYHVYQNCGELHFQVSYGVANVSITGSQKHNKLVGVWCTKSLKGASNKTLRNPVPYFIGLRLVTHSLLSLRNRQSKPMIYPWLHNVPTFLELLHVGLYQKLFWSQGKYIHRDTYIDSFNPYIDPITSQMIFPNQKISHRCKL